MEESKLKQKFKNSPSLNPFIEGNRKLSVPA